MPPCILPSCLLAHKAGCVPTLLGSAQVHTSVHATYTRTYPCTTPTLQSEEVPCVCGLIGCRGNRLELQAHRPGGHSRGKLVLKHHKNGARQVS